MSAERTAKMVEFDTYYSFAADQVECISSENGSDTHPYALSVYLKSGRKLTVNYKTQKDRDNAKRIMVNRIESELRRDREQIFNRLYLIDDTVKRIDKRQLRIWRQLKALLHLTEKEGEEL